MDAQAKTKIVKALRARGCELVRRRVVGSDGRMYALKKSDDSAA